MEHLGRVRRKSGVLRMERERIRNMWRKRRSAIGKVETEVLDGVRLLLNREGRIYHVLEMSKYYEQKQII